MKTAAMARDEQVELGSRRDDAGVKTSVWPSSSNHSAPGRMRAAAYATSSGTPRTITTTVARPRGRRTNGRC